MKKTNKNKRIIGGMDVDTVYVKIIAIVRSRQFSKYLFIRHRDNVLKH